ncbi:MAG TPA: TAXI family TRAP transporter solute-binding subunit [Steroidobacteraceae bacterium]|jgi:TRAP transporter TAXI family solute receptor|nr:TAXI family TRAP transporter solute-binding subunit [Steroidobacteraceae bacterium]
MDDLRSSSPGKQAPFVSRAAWLYGLAAALTLVAIVGTIVWLRPLPPKVVLMSTGTAGSDFDVYARQYQAILKRSGVQLRLLPSSGPIDNLKRLNDARSGVMVAFAPGGLTSAAQSPDLESLGTVCYEPLWFFLHRRITLERPDDLRGKKVAIGPEGSDTRHLAKRFLALNGVAEDQLQLLPLTASEAAEALLKGEIDAAAMVATWDTEAVRRLLASSDVTLFGSPRADAYAALYPYLTKLVLPMGVGNLATNRPSTDVNLVASEASLIVRKDLHPAVKYLLLEAATAVHSEGGLFRKRGQFPAPEPVDLPISKDARQFYRSGPPFLQRYLPYGLAVLASQLLVVLIPVFGVAYPLLRTAPALYGWNMRRRIFRLYGELKVIEIELETRGGQASDELLSRLARLEERANHVYVPFAFAPFLYQLRNHIGLVRERLQQSSSHPAQAPGEGSAAVSLAASAHR